MIALLAVHATALAQPASGIEAVAPLSGSFWSEYRIRTTGSTVTAYVAADHAKKPVILLLQGSGCTPLFTVDPDGAHHGTTIFQDFVASRRDRFHFVIVEKRGVVPLRFFNGMTQEDQRRAFAKAEKNCSETYHKNATKTARVDDAATAIATLQRQPWAGPLLLAGHSEGSQVVSGLVRRLPPAHVAAAALLSSAGPSQFFGFYVAQGAPDRARFREIFETMRWLQSADEDTDYRGHPARRWKTFALDSTPLDDVRDSLVPLFVAHGEREGNLLAADLFVLEALRQQPRRPIRYVVVADGDHGFSTRAGQERFAQTFDDFLQWAMSGERKTGAEVLR